MTRPHIVSAMLALLLTAALLPGCSPPAGGGNGEGPGHRSQRLGLTPEQEYSLGQQAYRQILAKSRVVRGGSEVERVRRVGARIVRAAEIEALQREVNYRLTGYRWDWEFNVLEDRQINAFCLPGGKVAVFSGLLSVAENDDQLATVLGHEIAHALAHHANERIARQQYQEHAIRAAGGVLGQLDPRHAELLIVLLGGVSNVQGLSYDRKQESEADHIGVFLMTFAGYDPEAALRFWQRMQQAAAGHGHPPAILSDHPSDAERLTQLQEWVPRARAGKRAFDAGRVARP